MKLFKGITGLKILSLLLCLVSVISVLNVSFISASAADNTEPSASNTVNTDITPATPDVVYGWNNKDNKWSFIGTDGALYKNGLFSIGGKKYLFDKNGYISLGFKTYKNKLYLFSESESSPEKGLGALKNYVGWKTIKSAVYYFEKDNSVYTSWKTIGKKTYYFSKNGKLNTGWKTIGKNSFYFSKNGTYAEKGVMLTGWKSFGKNKFYFKKYGKNGVKGSLFTGLKGIGKRTYYFCKKGKFGEKGALKTGWQKSGKYKYFFKTSGKTGEKGKMLKNQIAGSKKLGYGYVNKKGIRIKTNALNLAVKYVISHTSKNQSKSQKLKKCFNYLWRHYKYKRFYGFPNKNTLTKNYAEFMLKNKRGNCFCYGATFACIARVLGYESRVGTGLIVAARGGMTPHGWAEVKINGVWYMVDPDMQMNIPSVNAYLRTKNNYPYRFKCYNHYKLNFKKDKVVWKKTA